MCQWMHSSYGGLLVTSHGFSNGRPFFSDRGASHLAKTITESILPSTPQLPFRRTAASLRCRSTPQFSYLSSLFSNLFKSSGAGPAHLATKCVCVRACVPVCASSERKGKNAQVRVCTMFAPFPSRDGF